jgi:hypothetical protein
MLERKEKRMFVIFPVNVNSVQTDETYINVVAYFRSRKSTTLSDITFTITTHSPPSKRDSPKNGMPAGALKQGFRGGYCGGI